MLCKICGKEIVLVPSAAERVKKFGGKVATYTSLFTTHADCQISKNARELSDLLKRMRER